MNETNRWGDKKWQHSDLCVQCHEQQDKDDIDDDEDLATVYYNQGGINATPPWLLK